MQKKGTDHAVPFCNRLILNALCRSLFPKPAKPGFEEELFLAKGGFQMVEPTCLRVVLSEERSSHPIGVPALKQLEDEYLFASDLRHAVDKDFAG